MVRNAKLVTVGLLLMLCVFVILVAGSAAAGSYDVEQPTAEPTVDPAENPWGPPVGPIPQGKGVPLAPLTIARDDLAANATIVSDDFNACQLDTELWEIINPRDDASFLMKGTFTEDALLEIDVPSGLSHDPWYAGNYAPRVMQSVSDPENFDLEVKFESAVGSQWEMQGIFVEEAPDSFMRMEFHSDGVDTLVYWVILGPNDPGFTDPLTLTKKVYHQPVTRRKKAPLWMRVQRQGDTFSQYYSTNGTDWLLARAYVFPMAVTKVGVYGANGPMGSAPGHQAQVDYFMNTNSPIDPEDDDRNTLKLGAEPASKGTVTANPDKGEGSYACNEEVQLQATGTLGWGFLAWSGDLSGAENPTTIEMNGSRDITGTFKAALYTLTVAQEGQGLVVKSPDQASYPAGTIVTLTTVPAAGWTFQEWRGADAADLVKTGENSWTIDMDSPKSLQAVFIMNRVYVPIAVNSY